jgi:parallel beta-helix repeat protein/predicted outer membrane repeat protein
MVTFLKKIILIQVLMLVTLTAKPYTEISVALGNNIISADKTWTDDEYLIVDNVIIRATYTLTISPPSGGVTIKFDNAKYINVQGAIVASGNSNDLITFTQSTVLNPWSGIGFNSNSYTSSFSYCHFEYVVKSPGTCASNFTSCGAVYLNNTPNVSFSNCTFRYNEVCRGGGIAAISSGVSVSSCTFHDNEVEQYGGGIYVNDADDESYISDCNFTQNLATDYGGGIYVESCAEELQIYSNEFTLNEAVDGAGAYFTAIENSYDAFFLDNTLSQNVATGSGGGLYIEDSEINYISNNFLNQNEAEKGGAAYISETQIGSFEYNNLESNEAIDCGGGLVLFESYVEVVLGKIYNNAADGNGGGIYIEGQYTSGDPNKLINCQVTGNTTESNGGGIYTNYSFGSYSNTIADNAANTGTGGGIYHSGCTSTITNTILWDNTANTYDEAYPTPNGSNGYSYCCISGFTNCATCTTGDPNFIGSGNYMISYLPDVAYPATKESSCYNTGNNSATEITTYDLADNDRKNHNEQIDIGAYEDPYFYGNICYYSSGSTTANWTNRQIGTDYIVSGPIEICSTCTCTIAPGTDIAFKESTYLDVNGTITAGDATHTNTDYITFTAIDADDGWYGIDISLNSYTNQFHYCIFEKVKKTAAGGPNTFLSSGAVFVYDNSNNTSFNYCKFRNNQVNHCGGGLNFYESKATVNNCEFTDNIVTGKNGGGVFIGNNGGPHAISSCTFSGNTANFGGGGIWMSYPGTVTLTNSDFSQNESHSNSQSSLANCGGGAIGIAVDRESNNSITISGGTISNNTATNTTYGYGNGGGIFVCFKDDPLVNPLNISINNVYLSNNSAANLGGGIYLYDCDNNVTIHSSILHGNSALSNGGGIYMEDLSNSPILYNNQISYNVSTASNGGGIYIDDSNPKIYNCTVADNECDNQSGYAGGVYFDASSSPVFINTIAWWNIPANTDMKENGADPSPTSTGLYDFCDFRNFTSASGNNIIADPLFVDHTNGDYRISKITGAGSPCIDKGSDGISGGFTYPAYDIRGTGYDRKVDIYGYTNEIDMGAYEYEYDDPGDPHYRIVKSDSNSIDFKDFEMIVYPNPVESFYSLLLYSESEGKGSVQLYNSVGKEVFSKNLNIIEGENFYQFARNDLSGGIYYLQLRLQSGKTKTMKLIFN